MTTTTIRLAATTRALALATGLTAVVAVADMLDVRGLDQLTAALAALCLAAAALVLRLRAVALEVSADEVVVRNALRTHRLRRAEVAAVRPGRRRSTVVLRDGTEVPSLLPARDLPAHLLEADAPTSADLALVA